MSVCLSEKEVNIQDLLGEGQSLGTLHILVPRARNEQWLVAHAPIQLHAHVEWGLVRDGDYVYIPIIPYRTHTDPHKAIKFALTMGLRAGLDTHMLPNRDIKRLYLVTGTEIEDLAKTEGIEAFRFYLGFAVQTH
jgi:hypothetical protein